MGARPAADCAHARVGLGQGRDDSRAGKIAPASGLVQDNRPRAQETEPLVAILLCTKDGAEFLGAQLQSIAAQTHRRWTLVASDDDSSDGTRSLLAQFAPGSARGVVVRVGSGQGTCANSLALAADPTITIRRNGESCGLSPLFPWYLFVALDVATQRWRSVATMIGVSRLICNGECPAAIPAGVPAGLRAREGDDGLVRVDQRSRFLPGDRIRVVDGAFAPRLGLFAGLGHRDRVAVLFDSVGRKVRVVLDKMSVAAA